MAKLGRLPQSLQKSFEAFLSLTNAQRDAVLSALRTTKPSVTSKALVEAISSGSGLPESVARSVVGFILSLYSTHVEMNAPADQMVDDLFAQQIQDPSKWPGDSLAHTKNALREALSFETSVGVTAKAFRVLSQNKTLFVRSRVLSDLRPVFRRDPDQDPSATVIVHTLCIECREDGNKTELYIALDSEDLKDLHRSVERALRKDVTLQRLAKKLEIDCVRPGESDGH